MGVRVQPEVGLQPSGITNVLSSTCPAVTNARFATLHRLPAGPVPLSIPPVALLKPCASHERHFATCRDSVCFRLRLGGGVSLRLRFARRSFLPALNFPARRPQTEPGFKEAFGPTTALSRCTPCTEQVVRRQCYAKQCPRETYLSDFLPRLLLAWPILRAATSKSSSASANQAKLSINSS